MPPVKIVNDGADGYITELGYTHGYYRELNPLRARLALLKAGLPVPDISTACELGFGQGVSLAIHAAASSTVWYGNDLNAEHFAFASDLVNAAAVGARLHKETFTAFARRSDLPVFDLPSSPSSRKTSESAGRKIVVLPPRIFS